MRFTVNGKQMDVPAEPDASLLWVIREQLNLTGTKFGCGMAQCGVCTVHVLGERITLKNGVVQQSNFHDYPLLRLADTPEIHVHVIATDNPPGGIGEVGLPPTSGAIGNAVAALTGARVRHLPMVPERVLAALRSA